MRSTPISVAETYRLIAFTATALPIVIIDLRTYRIPDILSLGGFTIIALIDALMAPRALPMNLLAAALAAALFLALRAATRGLGLGDVKLAALIGLLVGPMGLIPAFLVAALGGLVFAAYSILIRKRGARERVPFAPFLVAGAYAAYGASIFGLDSALYGLIG
jgi:prepilin signal peptidase PulO-like enzyme (type II secretory pathway)